MKNKWSKAGIILNIIGIILAVVVAIVAFNFFRYISNNPEVLANLQNAGY